MPLILMNSISHPCHTHRHSEYTLLHFITFVTVFINVIQLLVLHQLTLKPYKNIQLTTLTDDESIYSEVSSEWVRNHFFFLDVVNRSMPWPSEFMRTVQQLVGWVSQIAFAHTGQRFQLTMHCLVPCCLLMQVHQSSLFFIIYTLFSFKFKMSK